MRSVREDSKAITLKRNKKILKHYKSGKVVKEIALQYNLEKANVYKIIAKLKRLKKANKVK